MGLNLDPRPEIFSSGLHELAVVSVVCLAQVLNQAGASHSLPMMNALEDVFTGVTSTDKAWFMAALPLTSGALILISGKFGDLYGLKKVLQAGSIWGMIWCLITGLSGYTNSVVFFCICRAMHGVGLAFLLPSAIGIAGSIYPNGQRKAYVFSLIGGMAPIGACMGAVFGGLTTTMGHWQWTYYANAIAFALLIIAAHFVIPDLPKHAPADAEMDWIGATVGVCGLVLFNVATNQAPQVGWDSPYVIVLFIVGFLLIVAFFFVEKRVEQPLLPLEALNSHTGLILACVAFGWSSFSIFLFYYWSMDLNLRHYTPLLTGATYATLAVCGSIAALSTGFFIRRVRPAIMLFISMSAFLIGNAMLCTTPVNQTYWQMHFPQQIIISFGMDISFPAASLVLSDNLPKKHQGMASSLVSTMTNYAMSISLGFAGTAEVLVLKHTGDTLRSYRAAEYVAVGLASFGCLLGIVLVAMSFIWGHGQPDVESKSEKPSVEVDHEVLGQKRSEEGEILVNSTH